MSRNLELKARYGSIARGRRIAASMGATSRGRLRQRDTFLLHTPRRLKLREESAASPELIYYGRPDSGSGSGRISSFMRVPVADPGGILRRWPGDRRGRTVVRKERSLYMFRNARIHLDTVKGLGTFIEFEVLMLHGTTQAHALLDQLVRAFNVQQADIIGEAYADLIRARLRH